VSLDGEEQLVAIHAAAVVGNANQRAAAILDRDFDRRSARVERVLDELLYRRRRPLDDFSGGDLVRDRRRENRNARRAADIRFAGSVRSARAGGTHRRPFDQGRAIGSR
jgi:hypothetical protein